MSYRSAEPILRSRLEEVEAALATARARARALEHECAVAEACAADLERRLQIAGAGGTAPAPGRDRIGVVVKALVAVAIVVVPLELYIGGYVRHQPGDSVVPCLLLGVPAVVAALVALPYRAQGDAYRVGFLLGAGLALAAILNVVLRFLP
jgi:hypothetical protein